MQESDRESRWFFQRHERRMSFMICEAERDLFIGTANKGGTMTKMIENDVDISYIDFSYIYRLFDSSYIYEKSKMTSVDQRKTTLNPQTRKRYCGSDGALFPGRLQIAP